MEIQKNFTNELLQINFRVRSDDFSRLNKMEIKKIFGYLEINHQNYEVQIKIRGSSTKSNPKRSFEVNFTNGLYYGQRTIHLNAEYWDFSLLRNKLSFDFFKDLNVLSPKAEHAIVFINNEYQGVYTLLESFDYYFLIRNNKPLGNIYYGVDSNANFNIQKKYSESIKSDLLMGYIKKYEYEDEDEHLRNLIKKINYLPKEYFYNMASYIDISNFIGWFLGAVLTSNYDGFNKNYALYYNSETGKFEISPWDYDGTWGRNWCGKVLKYNRLPIYGNNKLTMRIYETKSFKKIYINRMLAVFEEYFNEKNIKNKLDLLYNNIRSKVYSDIFKRGTNKEFEEEYKLIINYVKNRRNYLFKCIKG